VGVESVTYDVAVAGLGGMGSATLAHCAMRGARALGIEQFEPVHTLGASGGKSRIIRQAYYEAAAYVPLLIRAYELWHDLERRTAMELMRLTGLLMAGSENHDVIRGSSHAAKTYDLPVEYLSARDMRSRYPQLRVLEDEVGVFERNAGALFPERAIRAHLDIAVQHGAELRFGTALRDWKTDVDAVALEFCGGVRVRARSLVLTLGPWFAGAMREAGVPLEVQRNVQLWFDPVEKLYDAHAFPAFLLERDSLPAPLYGFPDFGDGVKAAFHGHGRFVEPDAIDREIDAARDVAPVAQALDQWMPGAASRYREGKACMYALTPDRHFIVDRHPRDSRVVLCGGFSGHGFKFAPVIGEIASQLALDGGTPHDIAFLSLHRFAS
jgi:sarcosine oxidase